jgi:integrase
VRGAKPRLHLPYDRWPAADRLLWEQAMASNDPFADAAGARLSKASRHNYLFTWRRFLGFLVVHDPRALKVAPNKRLTPERVKLFVGHLAETNLPQSVACQIGTLYRVARIMMPDKDWSWLRAIKARLHRAAPVHSPRGPVVTSVQLLELGLQLMEESKPAPGRAIGIEKAVKYRDGLMLALLALIPLRRKNLAALEVGRHLILERDCWLVIIPGEEAKAGTPIEFAVPELLNSYLAIYLDIVRARMLWHPGCTALWVSDKGGALVPGAIGQVFHRLSRRLGVWITPHDVRDAAATTWAISAPGHIGVARDLLAHADLRTTTRHYNRARGIEASRTYGQVIAAIRKTQRRRTSAE